VPIVYKSGSLNLPDPSRPRKLVSGLLYILIFNSEHKISEVYSVANLIDDIHACCSILRKKRRSFILAILSTAVGSRVLAVLLQRWAEPVTSPTMETLYAPPQPDRTGAQPGDPI
jgi:hypothetical protein